MPEAEGSPFLEPQDEQFLIKVPTKNVEKIKVTSFVEARPASLDELRLRQLQCDCDCWGIQTLRQENRGCGATQEAVQGRASGEERLRPALRSADRDLSEATPFGGGDSLPAKTAAASAAPRTSAPTPSTKKEGEPSRSFRSSEVGEPEVAICPRAGVEVPKDMEVNKIVPEGAAFFLGCSNFAAGKGCRLTMEMDKALEVRENVRAQQAKQP